MNKDIQELAELPSHEWKGPFEVATAWARKNFGRRLTPDTLRDAEAFLVANLTRQQQPTDTARGQNVPSDTEASLATTRVQVHAAPPSGTVSPPLPLPSRAPATSVANMADQRGGDGSPSSPAADEVAASVPPPLPLVSSPPLLALSPPSPSLSFSPPSLSSSPPPLFSPSSPPPSFLSPSPPSSLPHLLSRQQRDGRSRRRTTAEPTAEQIRPEQATSSTMTPTPLPPPHNPCGPHGELATFELSGEECRSNTSSPKPTSGLSSTSLVPKGLRSSSRPSPLTPEPHNREENIAVRQGATTPRKKLQQPSTCVTPVTPTNRPTKHGNTDPKNRREWVLCAKKEHVIIGDSNVSRLPPFQRRDLQVDSYPGATFHHAEAILRRSARNTSVKTLILSFGLNNRHQKPRETTIKQLQGAVRTAAAKFPGACILIPEVNFSPSFPLQQRLNLRVLNDHIKNYCMFIPRLPTTDFETEKNNVHWSSHTASRMLHHWMYQLHIKSLITM